MSFIFLTFLITFFSTMCKYKSVDAVLYAVFEYRRVSFFPLKHPEFNQSQQSYLQLETPDSFISFFFLTSPGGAFLFATVFLCRHWY